jgi:hypothetical protein
MEANKTQITATCTGRAKPEEQPQEQVSELQFLNFEMDWTLPFADRTERGLLVRALSVC